MRGIASRANSASGYPSGSVEEFELQLPLGHIAGQGRAAKRPIGLAVFDALDGPVGRFRQRLRDALDNHPYKALAIRVAGFDGVGYRLLKSSARNWCSCLGSLFGFFAHLTTHNVE